MGNDFQLVEQGMKRTKVDQWKKKEGCVGQSARSILQNFNEDSSRSGTEVRCGRMSRVNDHKGLYLFARSKWRRHDITKIRSVSSSASPAIAFCRFTVSCGASEEVRWKIPSTNDPILYTKLCFCHQQH